MRPWREQLEEECTFDLAAKKADTLEELAEKTGVNMEGFLAQIAGTTQTAPAGQDSQFGKAAPFPATSGAGALLRSVPDPVQ